MNKDFKNHIEKSLSKNIRIDGRKNDEFRKITVETGIISTAEGSARVTCGDTEVIVGVKLDIGKPYPDKLDEGVLMTGAELYPLSNPEFESGPPREESIEIARVIDRGIRESGTIDVKKLCIEAGEKVWMINVDIAPINMDGNLIDIGALAVMAALKDTKFPELKDGVPDYKKISKKKLPISKLPIEITILKIGDTFLVDPTYSEEKLTDARLTVAILEDDSLCAMQKGGEEPLTQESIMKMIDIAIKKSKELRKFLA
ncbi:MAG: exosome complex protein Rrp42 [Nanoarchaeota archaeon]|nr:exosome complex protein Rrp42 [Nanoarchaeota archaeon]MBU1269645.1 exosome complex protein Rrp42 [Nanoarchaeota archaeon]MBU1605078.1 exosome complex protein Rrp42 [Nanoarchaeota archaeon]